MIDLAARSKGSSPEQITQGLYSIKDYRGASAVLSINEKGTAPQYEAMFRISGGKLTPSLAK